MYYPQWNASSTRIDKPLPTNKSINCTMRYRTCQHTRMPLKNCTKRDGKIEIDHKKTYYSDSASVHWGWLRASLNEGQTVFGTVWAVRRGSENNGIPKMKIFLSTNLLKTHGTSTRAGQYKSAATHVRDLVTSVSTHPWKKVLCFRAIDRLSIWRCAHHHEH